VRIEEDHVRLGGARGVPRKTANTPHRSLSSSPGTWPWLTTRRPLRPYLMTTSPLKGIRAEVRQGQRGRGGRERHLHTIEKREREREERGAGRRAEVRQQEREGTGATLTRYWRESERDRQHDGWQWRQSGRRNFSIIRK
jgi:hypothetical protein